MEWREEGKRGKRTKLVRSLALDVLFRHPQQAVVRQRDRKMHRISLVARVVLKESNGLDRDTVSKRLGGTKRKKGNAPAQTAR